MKLYYREDLVKVQIIDDIKSQLRNAKIFSVIMLITSILNIYNTSLPLLVYLSSILLVLVLLYSYYIFLKKSYEEFYSLSEINGFQKKKILHIDYYRLALKNGKHRDLDVSNSKKSLQEVEEFCQQHNIPILN